jgi:predicted PilT family ATPase
MCCLVQVKILVPNSTAGMIIGKGGNYIKQMKEESGSYVQISQKAKDQTLQERCITVIGKSVLWTRHSLSDGLWCVTEKLLQMGLSPSGLMWSSAE